jgi:hypothetical protein
VFSSIYDLASVPEKFLGCHAFLFLSNELIIQSKAIERERDLYWLHEIGV